MQSFSPEANAFLVAVGEALGRGFARGIGLGPSNGTPTEANSTGQARSRRVREPTPRMSALSVGQVVWYRQGRGTFEAEVVESDVERGAVMLRRKSDGKVVRRPASKVIV